MMKTLFQRGAMLCLSLLVFKMSANAQFADSVASVSFGANFNVGYGSDNPNFPSCVLGRPDTSARPCAPAFSPSELLSLGTGGSITFYFRFPIVNLAGVDFTIFENSFYLGCDTTRIYAETAIVSASKDGIHFIEFPFEVVDSLPINSPLRYRGLAGVTPSNGAVNPLLSGSPNQSRSGGDSFDLSIIGIDSAYYIRITDAGERVNDGGLLAASCDLDAVVALHQASLSSPIEKNKPKRFTLFQNYPNPFNPTTTIEYQLSEASEIKLELFDAQGKKIAQLFNQRQEAGAYRYSLSASELLLSSGVYFYRLSSSEFSETKSMIFVK